MQAADRQSPDCVDALESLCQRYWYPLYAFVRRKGSSRVEAEDRTQAFFASILEKNSLQFADQQRGRFRTFLLSAFDNFLKNQWRKAQAQKRGGEKTILSIDSEKGEQRYQNEPFHKLTAEKIFDRSWAITLLATTMDELANQYSDSGKQKLFDRLKPYLAGQGGVPYAQIGKELDMTEGSIKVAVHRMRGRCREVLREKIGETVETDAEIDQEISVLFTIVES